MAGNTVDINLRMRDDGSVARATQSMQRANAEKEKLESRDYGVARSAVGTGAAGRDFARQAEGLGGFVRLYATFAANAFAAQAAFTALSNAMDTTNMVKGMDQLGAASGVALGGLSKQFAAATQGAISFREAAQAVTKATASGLGASQTLEIAQLATKASQALGVDLGDAVNRLTRGITKLEPELLDELGIFTKIDPAVEAYARKIGKATTQLTDFERRQAFAVAVLDEARKKFNEIDIDTNPYSKLLASFKNIAQSGLEVVNFALAPIARLLSESPTALTAAIAGIGTLLLRQAIPALSQFRTNLEETTKTSALRALGRVEESRSAVGFRAERARAQAKQIADDMANVQTEAFFIAQDKLRKLYESNELPRSFKPILKAETVSDVNQQQLAAASRTAAEIEARYGKAVAQPYREAIIAVTETQKAEQKYAQIRKDTEESILKQQRTSLAVRQEQILAQRALNAALRDSLVLEAERTARNAGFFAALADIGRNISARRRGPTTQRLGTGEFELDATGARVEKTVDVVAPKMSLLSAATYGVRGALTAATVGLSRFLAVLSPWLAAISLALPVLGVFIDRFRDAKKATDEFDKSLELAKENAKTASDVYKKFGDTLSLQGSLAKANAFQSVAKDVQALTDNLLEADKKSNFLDRQIDIAKSFFGADLLSKFGDQVSDSIVEGLKVIRDPGLKKDVQAQLQNLLGVDVLDEKTIGKAIRGLSPEAAKSLAKQLKDIFDKAAIDSERGVSSLRGLKDGYDALEKSYANLANSFVNRDLGTVFALDLIKQSNQLNAAIQDSQNRVEVLKDILENTSKIRMFPPEAQKTILDAAQNIQQVTNDVSKYEQQLRTATAELEALRNLQAGGGTLSVEIKTAAEQKVAAAAALLNVAKDRLSSINAGLSGAFSSAVETGFKLIEAPLVRAISQGAITVLKTSLSYLPKTQQSIQLGTRLDIAAIDLQKQEIQETKNLINSMTLLRLSNERIKLEEKMAQATNLKERESIGAAITEINRQEQAVKEPQRLRQELKAAGEMPSDAVASILSQDVGIRTKLAQFDAQIKSLRVKEQLDLVIQDYDRLKTAAENQLKQLQQQNKEFFASPEFFGLTEAEQIREKTRRQLQEAVAASDIQNIEFARDTSVFGLIQQKAAGAPEKSMEAQLGAAAKEATEQAVKQLEARIGIEQSAAREIQLLAEKEARQKEVARFYKLEASSLQYNYTQIDARRQLEDAIANTEKSRFDTLANLGRFTEQEIQDKNRVFAIEQARREEVRELENIQRRVRDAELKFREAYAAGTDNDLIDTTRMAFLAEKTAAETATMAVKENTKAKIENANLNASISVEQKKFTDFFTQSFEKMGDAIAEFAMTGKLNFKSLMNSIVSDFIRMTIRMSMQKLTGGAGGQEGLAGTFASALAKALGFGGTGGYTQSMDTVMGLTAAGYKDGAAWDQGVQKFAQGGMFTNSIVHSPTLFKFAKGTGLMGEAGPEAIMPLARDNNGRLGVQAQGTQPQVDVVVNNYSGQEATTRETKDSRGNRKIEVVVGDMTAAEMSRPGSSTQQTLRSNFGIQPTIMRR